jgi:hypothetical protein
MTFSDRYGPIVRKACPDRGPLRVGVPSHQVFRAALDQMTAISG